VAAALTRTLTQHHAKPLSKFAALAGALHVEITEFRR
jgi:hypothetical protein